MVTAALVSAAPRQPQAITPPNMTVAPGSAAVEQNVPGGREPAAMVASFDGLGEGFDGPQGTATLRNPSDNSVAVGPDHVVVTVNSRMAVFSKKGRHFDQTGRPAALRTGQYEQRVQGIWRSMRGVEQR